MNDNTVDELVNNLPATVDNEEDYFEDDDDEIVDALPSAIRGITPELSTRAGKAIVDRKARRVRALDGETAQEYLERATEQIGIIARIVASLHNRLTVTKRQSGGYLWYQVADKRDRAPLTVEHKAKMKEAGEKRAAAKRGISVEQYRKDKAKAAADVAKATASNK